MDDFLPSINTNATMLSPQAQSHSAVRFTQDQIHADLSSSMQDVDRAWLHSLWRISL